MIKIFVDGYCSGNPGKCGFRGVMNDIEIFRHELGYGTNNIAEFVAIVTAIHYAIKNEYNAAIFSDSQTAIAWVKNGKSNSSVEHYALKRSEDFLVKNDWRKHVDIYKWDTKILGEIPADFGYKNK